MKKLLLLIFCLSACLCMNGQSLVTVTNSSDGSVLSNSTTIYVTTTVGGLADELDFSIKNISGVSKDFLIRRIDIALNKISSSDSAEAYFCFGTSCFPSTTTITPTPFTIASNGAQSLKTYLQEASMQGYSSVKYQIIDASNSNTIFTFTMVYNSALSVKENVDLFSSVSNVYPNPANQNANLKIHSTSNTKNAVVSITNTLGTTMYSNNIELNAGENTIRLTTENLPSGIYFTTITSGKNKIIKKFVINK